MDYEDKLIEFIDGELPDEQERELFSVISADDSLRAEYKSLLGITNTIKSSAAYYSPSTELKTSVYRDLNISIPAKHIPAPAKILHGTKWYLFSGSIGALLASAVFMVSTNLSTTKISNVPSVKMNKPLAVQQFEPQMAKANNERFTINQNIHKIHTVDNKYDHSSLSLVTEENEPILLALSEPISIVNKNFTDTNNPLFELIDNSDLINKPDIQNDKPVGISIEGKYSLNWNQPKETLEPTKTNPFNNLGFDIFFNIIDNLDFGINIKQESFYTKFEEQFSQNQILKYEQNSNLTSYGITLRQRFLPENKLQPLGQINFAFNDYGIILRPSAGILYKLNDAFSLVGDFEYSYMLFTYKSKWFSASKIGLNFGINYKF